jgi:hypothetical protein
MTKSSTPKVLAEKARDTYRKSAAKVAAQKTASPHVETAPKVAPENAVDTHRSTAPKVASAKTGSDHLKTARKPSPEAADTNSKAAPKGASTKAGDGHFKTALKITREKSGDTQPRAAPKPAAEKSGDAHRKTATKVAAEIARDTLRKTTAQFEQVRDTQVPDSMRALAERNVAQTRALYERSKNALQAVLESWENFLGGAAALNRKIIDMTERNIASSFDLATNMAGAKNLAEAVELQAAYWRKQFGDVSAQAEQMRVLSIKVSAEVAQPVKAQLTAMDWFNKN